MQLKETTILIIFLIGQEIGNQRDNCCDCGEGNYRLFLEMENGFL